MGLYGATVDVTLGANQQISATMTADFGGDVSVNSSNLYLNLCYMPQGGALVVDDKFFGPLAAGAGTDQTFSLTRSFAGLAAGTYTVGLCACVFDQDPTLPDANWTHWNTAFSWADVRVFQQ
jgi:hypothetical protein